MLCNLMKKTEKKILSGQLKMTFITIFDALSKLVKQAKIHHIVYF
jgi:hypothetical protein